MTRQEGAEEEGEEMTRLRLSTTQNTVLYKIFLKERASSCNCVITGTDEEPVLRVAIKPKQIQTEQTENLLISQSQEMTMIKILCGVSMVAKPQVVTAITKQIHKADKHT